MKEIIIDNTLVIEQGKKELHPEHFFNLSEPFEPITKIESEITHRNYLDYLCLCWKTHYGVIISPTILWNLVLANLAYEVNKRPDKYRKYFTTSNEKQDILVMQGGNQIDPALLIEAVSNKIPSKIMNHIFPEFTTDTEKSKTTNYVAFLDMVSPYYNYFMYLCGISKVKVLGTKEDWQTFLFKLGSISSIIVEPVVIEYILTVSERIKKIIEGFCDYGNIFSLDRCGSGSQAIVQGWIREFYIEQPQVAYPENFISCISKIDYKCLNDGKDYRLYAGLFTSKIENEYLVPDFDHMYFVKAKAQDAPETSTNSINLNLETRTIKGGYFKVTEKDFSTIVKGKKINKI